MAQITQDDIKRVKGLGCIRDKRFEDVFNVRVPLGNGKITAEVQRAIADAAEKYGSGEVALTTRLSYEIQGVKYENIEPLRDYLKKYGLDSGGTGPKVRPVVCCKGTTCTFGLIDTYGLAKKLHEKFYIGMHDVTLPGKFKIGVGGCPNNCIKPDLNDVGIRGHRVVEDGRGVNCYVMYIGGRWGKQVGRGTLLNTVFKTEDEVIAMLEKIIAYYMENGLKGERFAKTIERIGFENVEKALLSDSK